jgi:hypothetical protein
MKDSREISYGVGSWEIWYWVVRLALVMVYLQGLLPLYKIVSFFYAIDLWNVLTITSIKEIVICMTFSSWVSPVFYHMEIDIPSSCVKISYEPYPN